VGSDLIDLGLSVRTKSGDFAHRPLTGSVCVWRVRRRCHKGRLACVRARALAATREATVVHVYNTAMISKRVHFV
jgi:hypothetical protein